MFFFDERSFRQVCGCILFEPGLNRKMSPSLYVCFGQNILSQRKNFIKFVYFFASFDIFDFHKNGREEESMDRTCTLLLFVYIKKLYRSVACPIVALACQ